MKMTKTEGLIFRNIPIILLLLFMGCGDNYIVESENIHGCLDSQACNYNSEAIIDNNSCDYSCIDCLGELDGNAVIDDCGECNGNNSTCTGCTDPEASNYNPDAIIDDGSCDLNSCGDFIDGNAYQECCNSCIGEITNIEDSSSTDYQPFIYIEPGNSLYTGNPNSSIVIQEFFSSQCPYCAQSRSLIEEIKTYYNNDVKIVFKNAPLSFHHESDEAALYMLAAERQGVGFGYQLYQLILENYQQLNNNPLYPLELAYEIGLDTTQINLDIQDPTLSEQLDWEWSQFIELERLAVPTFIINGYRLHARSLAGVIEIGDCLELCE